MSKTIFITFGSHANYLDAGSRLLEQSKKMDIFSETILYTPEYLKNDEDFWNKHGAFITNNPRGYGYWLWKIYIIKKTMEKMNDTDILLYLDCGCELGLNRKDNLVNCINVVKTDKIITTVTHVERQWTKMDLIKKLDMNKDEYLNTPHCQAGAILFLVCDETRRLVNEWYELGCDYHNIDDSPSVTLNLNSFVEHRHDQSIFSLLTKKYNIPINIQLYDAVYYIRNRSGASII